MVTSIHCDNGALSKDDIRKNFSRRRVVVEQAFVRLKCKRRQLCELQNSHVDVVVKVMVAECALDNMSIGECENTCEEHPHECPREEDDNE